MTNGIKDPVEVLRFWPRENYLRKPLPSPRDDRITDLIETLTDEESVTRVSQAVATVETVLSPYGRHGKSLQAFVRRDAQDRLITAMGYAEVGKGADFRYESRW